MIDIEQSMQLNEIKEEENMEQNQNNSKEAAFDYQLTYYLSSEVQSYDKYSDNSYEDDKAEIIANYFLFFCSFIIQFITYFIYVVFIPIILFRNMYIEKRVDHLKERLWVWISLWSIMYLIIIYFWFPSHIQEINYLLEDEMLFIFTTFLVFSYIRAIDVQSSQKFYDQLERITNIYQNAFQLTYFSNYLDQRATQLDYNSEVVYKKQHQIPSITTHYSLMSIKKIVNLRDHNVTEMISSFNDYLTPNMRHFLIQIFILSLKVFFILLYILRHSGWKEFQSIFNFLMICLVYIYITFNLNRALGNNDLRKKINQMEKFNDFVDYSNINSDNFKQKLDVTCPISIQTWDTVRKFILGYKRSYLQALEISYLSLIFYYLLVIVICLSAYFELEWLIPKNSQLLKPVVVIMSTFNFLFLSIIFMQRFNVGTKYNKSFEKLLSSVRYLQNIYSDLNTMYPIFFLQNTDSTQKENRFSAYGLIIKRIKLISNHYIETQTLYKDKTYQKQEKQELRRLIISTVHNQLYKIKESILLDELEYKYKLLNFLEINNNDFLFTLFLGLASTLPTIIPIFISYFKT